MSKPVSENIAKKPIRIILRHNNTGAHGESLEAVYKTVDIDCEELERYMMPRDFETGGLGLTVIGAEIIDPDESRERLYKPAVYSEDELPFDDDTPQRIQESGMSEHAELVKLLQWAETIAEDDYDGHLTIMRFTTGWKSAFGTPNLDGAGGRESVEQVPGFKTLDESLQHLVEHKTSLYDL